VNGHEAMMWSIVSGAYHRDRSGLLLEAMAISPIRPPVPASQSQPKEDLDSERRPTLPHGPVTMEIDRARLYWSMMYADLVE